MYGIDDDPDMARRVKAVESAMVTFPSTPQSSTSRVKSQEMGSLFNDKKFQFLNCMYIGTSVSGVKGGMLALIAGRQ